MLFFRANILKLLPNRSQLFSGKLKSIQLRHKVVGHQTTPTIDTKRIQRQDIFKTRLPEDRRDLDEFLNGRIDLKDLNSALHFIAVEHGPKNLFGPIEEKLLSLLVPQDDDLVSNYLSQNRKRNYETLCDTFIYLAENHRRPTPLLKALAIELCKTSIEDGDFTRSKVKTIAATLNALVGLSYPNVILVSKLLGDLERIINLDEIGSNSLNTLLWSLASLNWRADELLTKIYDHVVLNMNDPESYDQNVIPNLLYASAITNFKPRDLEKFYRGFFLESRENLLDRNSRRWLNYVWSLAILKIVEKRHLESVLHTEFQKNLVLSNDSLDLSFSDMMKLLNLRAIAKLEFKLDLSDDVLTEISLNHIRRSASNQKFAVKMNETLANLMETSVSNLKCDYLTPFGFMLDCEVLLDSNSDLHPLDCEKCLEELVSSGSSITKPQGLGLTRCALIYTYFEDMIANSKGEVVGHKKIIARILRHYGYITVFLPETLLDKEKTSAGFSNQVKYIIQVQVDQLKKVDS